LTSRVAVKVTNKIANSKAASTSTTKVKEAAKIVANFTLKNINHVDSHSNKVKINHYDEFNEEIGNNEDDDSNYEYDNDNEKDDN
ncbi:10088_t:CDS:2, partial [Funneliformis mosseae]